MEAIILFATEHAAYAHWIFFGLLLLTGINVPLSEDVIIIFAGALAGMGVLPDPTHLYIWIYFGAYIAAWEAFWIGRLLGPKLFKIKFLSKTLNPERLNKVKRFYERYGFLTFLIGRFIPFGVRNCLFMSSGMGGMPFRTYLWRDGIACLGATLFLFYMGYSFGQNYELLLQYLKTYEIIIGSILLTLATTIGFVVWRRKKQAKLVASEPSEL